MGLIQGSVAQAVPLVVGFDIVYVHTNIQPILDDQNNSTNIFQYNEIQYNKDEYIKFMSEKNSILENKLTDTQLALCEIYENMEGTVI